MNEGKDEWVAIGFTAGIKAAEVDQSATKAQGFHAEHMLVVFEETPGIAQAIMTAFQNTCVAPHNIIMALGNPDNQFDTLHRFSKLSRVVPIQVSGFDHPNVVLKNPNYIPGAQSEQGLKDMLDRYNNNKEHPLYKSRARGLSPTQSKEALIRYEWIQAAIERRKKFEDENGIADVSKIKGRKARGVDVANSENGDEAAIARGKGNVLIEVESFPCPDSNALGTRIHQEMIVEKISDQDVGVDGVGVGAGTVNELKRLKRNVINIISSEKQLLIQDEKESDDDEAEKIEPVQLYNNLRSQMWWQAAEDLQRARVCIPNDPELIADLLGVKYKIVNGKIVVQSKEELKKIIGRSPNKGDAFVYWNWVRSMRSPLAAIAGIKARKENEKEPVKPKRLLEVNNRDTVMVTGRMKRSF
jgi:hypothetical protein